MRALPSLRALALPTAVLLTSGACSLMAPSDAELLGDAAQPSSGQGGEGERAGSSTGLSGSTAAAEGGGASEPGPAALGGDASAAGGETGAGGDFTTLIPQDGLALWLMADHGVADIDGRLVVWSDFSPNEHDAKQPSIALQPKLLPATASSPQVVEFDGTGEQLAFDPGFEDFSLGLTAFVIATAAQDSYCQALLHFSNGGEADDIQIGRFNGSVHYEVAVPSVTGPMNAFTIGQRMLVGVLHAPGKQPNVTLNGSLMGTGDFTELPAVTERTTNFIGRSMYSDCQPFQGQIGEIILYARALDAAERTRVQAYLQSKWSYEPPVKTKPGPGEIPAAE